MSEENVIHYGDVIKLFVKSAHHEGEGGHLGFIKQGVSKKADSPQVVLVVPPVEGIDFKEAEFIVAPTREEKSKSQNTPLKYKTPFVLKTSDGAGYALNNKTPSLNDFISLQPQGVKGEMYVQIEKEGYTSDTHVHDGDMNVVINVVDSNRIRTKYNKPLTHFAKAKHPAHGGIVSSGVKGQQLSFKITKVPDSTTTPRYIDNPVARALVDDEEDSGEKKDETNEPELAAPADPAAEDEANDGNDSKTSSAASLKDKAGSQANQDDGDGNEENAEQDGDPVSPTSDTTTAEGSEPSAPAFEEANEAPSAEKDDEASAEMVEAVIDSTSKEAAEGDQAPSEALATLPADPEATPVVDKLTAIPQQISSTTVGSEGDAIEQVEQVETGCVGKCTIM